MKLIKLLLILLMLCCLAGSATATVPTGEILHLNFDEGTGSTAADSTANNHDATLGANAAWSDGRGGGHGIRVNATTNSLLTISDTDLLDLYNTDFSISYDMKLKSDIETTGDNHLFYKRTSAWDGWGVLSSIWGNPAIHRLSFSLADDATNRDSTNTEDVDTWPQNTWINEIIAYDVDTGTMKTYRNGALVSTSTFSTITPSTAAKRTVADLILFNGADAEFDNVNIFNRTITDSTEIDQLVYNGDASNQTYYVSTIGSDNNPGTQAEPFLTIAHATGLALPGDVINVNSGTYAESGITFSESGTSQYPITLRNNGTVTIQGSGQATGFDVRKSNITIDGIRITGFQTGILDTTNSNVSFKNITFTNISAKGLDLSAASNITLNNISVSDSSTVKGLYIDTVDYLSVSSFSISNTIDNGITASVLNNSIIDTFTASYVDYGFYQVNGTNITLKNFDIRNTINGGVSATSDSYINIINGSVINTSEHGVHLFNNINYAYVSNVTFRDNWHNQLDLHTQSSVLAPIQNITVDNCHFSYTPTLTPVNGNVISFVTHNVNCWNITLKNSDFNYTVRPNEFWNTRGLLVENNTYRNIRVHDTTSTGRLWLLGSLGDAEGYSDVNDNRGVYDAIFRNNTISGNANTLYILSGSGTFPSGDAVNVENITFYENKYYSPSADFIYLDALAKINNVTWDKDKVFGTTTGNLVETNVTPASAIDAGVLDSNLLLMFPNSQSFMTGESTDVTQIVADFTASPLSGTASTVISFTDASTGYDLNYSWDFDNDGIEDSTEQNPKYPYTSAGNKTINLTVTNEFGSDSEVKTDYITIENSDINFTAYPATSGVSPLKVRFNDTSELNSTAWSWDFGDGSPVVHNISKPYHTFKTGNYTVNMTVTNAEGTFSEVKTNYITVTGQTAPSTLDQILAILSHWFYNLAIWTAGG